MPGAADDAGRRGALGHALLRPIEADRARVPRPLRRRSRRTRVSPAHGPATGPTPSPRTTAPTRCRSIDFLRGRGRGDRGAQRARGAPLRGRPRNGPSTRCSRPPTREAPIRRATAEQRRLWLMGAEGLQRRRALRPAAAWRATSTGRSGAGTRSPGGAWWRASTPRTSGRGCTSTRSRASISGSPSARRRWASSTWARRASTRARCAPGSASERKRPGGRAPALRAPGRRRSSTRRRPSPRSRSRRGWCGQPSARKPASDTVASNPTWHPRRRRGGARTRTTRSLVAEFEAARASKCGARGRRDRPRPLPAGAGDRGADRGGRARVARSRSAGSRDYQGQPRSTAACGTCWEVYGEAIVRVRGAGGGAGAPAASVIETDTIRGKSMTEQTLSSTTPSSR